MGFEGISPLTGHLALGQAIADLPGNDIISQKDAMHEALFYLLVPLCGPASTMWWNRLFTGLQKVFIIWNGLKAWSFAAGGVRRAPDASVVC